MSLSYLIQEMNELGYPTQSSQWKLLRTYQHDGSSIQDFVHPDLGQATVIDHGNEMELVYNASAQQAIAAIQKSPLDVNAKTFLSALDNLHSGEGRFWSKPLVLETLSKIETSPSFPAASASFGKLFSFYIESSDLNQVDPDASMSNQILCITGPVDSHSWSVLKKYFPVLSKASLKPEDNRAVFDGSSIGGTVCQTVDTLLGHGFQHDDQSCLSCHPFVSPLLQLNFNLQSSPTVSDLNKAAALVGSWWIDPAFSELSKKSAVEQSAQWNWLMTSLSKLGKFHVDGDPNDPSEEAEITLELASSLSDEGKQLVSMLLLEKSGCLECEFEDTDDDLWSAYSVHPGTTQDLINTLTGLGVPFVHNAPAAPVPVVGPVAPQPVSTSGSGNSSDSLHEAIASHKNYQLQKLLSAGADPNSGVVDEDEEDYGHPAPLKLALQHKNPEAFQLLLQAGADVSRELLKEVLTPQHGEFSFDGYIKPLIENIGKKVSDQDLDLFIVWQMRTPPAKLVQRHQILLRKALAGIQLGRYNDALLSAAGQESKGWLVKPWSDDLATALATDPRGPQQLITRSVTTALENEEYGAIREMIKISQIKPSMIVVQGLSLLDWAAKVERGEGFGHSHSGSSMPPQMATLLASFGGPGNDRVRQNKNKMFNQSMKMLQAQITQKEKALQRPAGP